MQSNLIFVCGGCDYDHYNVRNEAFYYSIVDEPLNANDSEPLETKIFKLVLFHFLIYANVPLHEFSILLIAEVEIYFVISTKAIKKFL